MTETLLFVLRTFFVILIYAFLFVSIRGMVSVLRKAQETGSEISPEANGSTRGKGKPAIVVNNPGRSTLKKGQKLFIDTAITLGRDSRNQVVVEDPFVSSSHAAIKYQDGSYWLEDLDSKNGTFLNGKRVTREQRLKAGDEIMIGGAILEFMG